MGLAVLLDAVSERLHAPGLDLRDLAAIGFDDALEGFCHRLNLLRRHILTREIDMLVKRHYRAFRCCGPRREALRARRPERRLPKAETREDGIFSPKVQTHPFRSAPGRTTA